MWPAPLPQGPFDIILADPPWRFATWSDKGRDRCPDGPRLIQRGGYRTLGLEEIVALPISDITAENAVCLLWCPPPFLLAALEVLDAWRFDYKANWVWVRPGAPGTGYWSRTCYENLLVGARGRGMCPPPALHPRSVLMAPKADKRHSRKPVELYERVECLWSTAAKVELFARAPCRAGWTCWGDESSEAAA
jgi:N6-adenosine-specific RNA methylase IME4